MIAVLPDVQELSSKEEIIEYLIDVGLIYNENIEDIIYSDKVEEVVKEYCFSKKIYFKYIDLNDTPLNVNELINYYNKN